MKTEVVVRATGQKEADKMAEDTAEGIKHLYSSMNLECRSYEIYFLFMQQFLAKYISITTSSVVVLKAYDAVASAKKARNCEQENEQP